MWWCVTRQPDHLEGGRRLRPSNDTRRIFDALARASSDTLSAPEMLSVAELVVHLRSLRTNYLPARLLGEPVWDIMLELLQAELVDQTVTTTQLSVATRLPLGVAVRWVEVMIQNGLCSSTAGDNDDHVQLTVEASAALRGYLAQLSHAIDRRQ